MGSRPALTDLYISRMDSNRCYKIHSRRGIPGHPYGSYPFVDAVITRHVNDSVVGYFNYKIDRSHIWPAVRRPFCGLLPFVPRHTRRWTFLYLFLSYILELHARSHSQSNELLFRIVANAVLAICRKDALRYKIMAQDRVWNRMSMIYIIDCIKCTISYRP